MIPIVSAIQAFSAANPTLATAAAAGISGGLIIELRNAPMQLYNGIKNEVCAQLTVYDNEEAYEYVNLWLSEHQDAKKVRRMTVAEHWDREKEKFEFKMTPGSGVHLMFEEGKPVWLKREISEQPTGFSGKRQQTITLTTLGRSQRALHSILEKARNVRDKTDLVAVYVWRDGYFALVERRPKRGLDTIYLDEEIKTKIVDDITSFVDRRKWYAQRGVPYRRGYCFEGPPGTGKSTLIFVLAGLLQKAVYIIHPQNINDDASLQAAMNAAGSGIVVIEDIDGVQITHSRDQADEERKVVIENGGAPVPASVQPKGISLSGMLNAIDGIAAKDGRILIITSNHADKLDDALLRPGRVDLRMHLDKADEGVARQMHERHFPGASSDTFIASLRGELPMAQAELQNRLLGLAGAL